MGEERARERERERSVYLCFPYHIIVFYLYLSQDVYTFGVSKKQFRYRVFEVFGIIWV